MGAGRRPKPHTAISNNELGVLRRAHKEEPMSDRPGNALMPNLLTPQDLEPNWEWREKLPAHGHMSVDFERRIDHDRLRRYRLARTRQSLQNSNAGTLLLFGEQYPLRLGHQDRGMGTGQDV